MVEAWIYVLVLLVAAGICQWRGQWWPMWPLLGAIAVLAGLRLR
ncbi:hypothetical protein [Salidesulfovibrio brasiliensis]|nr:hypothetical protein [Salidesulfovibrio brasiliensis]